MSHEEDDGHSFDQEPRKIFVSYLMKTLFEIECCMYHPGGQVTQSIRMMRGIIRILDKESKAKLSTQLQQLQNYETNIRLASRQSLEEIHDELLTYLHETYLRDVRFAKPQFKKGGKLEV